MNNKRTIGIIIFGIYLIILGCILLLHVSTFSINLSNKSQTFRNAADNTIRIAHERYYNYEYENKEKFEKEYLKEIDKLKNYLDKIIYHNAVERKILALSISITGFIAGFLYIFAGLGMFFAFKNTILRLKIGITFYSFFLALTICDLCIILNYFVKMFGQLEILYSFFSTEVINLKLINPAESYYVFIPILIILINLILFVLLPNWLINKTKMRQFFNP